MKTTLTFLTLALLAFWLADCSTATKPVASATPPVPDPIAAARARQSGPLRAQIAGRENSRADSVFQNIERLNGVTAGRLLDIMDIWGSVLGVGCEHCHVPNEWASEAKPEKEITRQMMTLTSQINENLNKIQALEGAQASVSCYTCHRGNKRPATRPKE